MLNLPELRGKYREHLENFIRNVLKRPDVVGILLFGSAAKGREKPYPQSDIDVLVIAENLHSNPAKRKLELIGYKKEAEAVEDIWLTPEELLNGVEGGWGTLLDAISDGKVIYDKTGIFKQAKEIIARKHRRIGRIWQLHAK